MMEQGAEDCLQPPGPGRSRRSLPPEPTGGAVLPHALVASGVLEQWLPTVVALACSLRLNCRGPAPQHSREGVFCGLCSYSSVCSSGLGQVAR